MNKNKKFNDKYKNRTKQKKAIQNYYEKYLKKHKNKINNLTLSNLAKSFIIFGILFSKYFFNFSSSNNKRYYKKYEKGFDGNSICHEFDPIHIFETRLKNDPFEICNEKNTKHICYINPKDHYNNTFRLKEGFLCIMENIVLDPSKFIESNEVFKGHVKMINDGFPLLSKGFLNTKCNNKKIKLDNKNIYREYFKSWNYDFNIKNENENLEELAPGKTVFLLGRNQDSANLYHGNCEVINVLCMLYIFNLPPEKVQLVIFSGLKIPEDPFIDLYKSIFYKNKIIYMQNLKKKYKISKAIKVPLNWDSPIFTKLPFPKCDSTMKTFKLYNDFVDKYLNLKPFKDTFISDNVNFFYPEKTIKNYKKGIKFKKIITVQWRKVWPAHRRGQTRILGKSRRLTSKIAESLPDNFLIRLINTAAIPYKDQISLMRNTDYLLGIHGAGLSLSIFLPKSSILHEIYAKKMNDLLTFMSALSGHVCYSDLIKSKSYPKRGNGYVEFDEDEVIEKVLNHMKESNFFK